jgi:hypothetical protein
MVEKDLFEAIREEREKKVKKITQIMCKGGAGLDIL